MKSMDLVLSEALLSILVKEHSKKHMKRSKRNWRAKDFLQKSENDYCRNSHSASGSSLQNMVRRSMTFSQMLGNMVFTLSLPVLPWREQRQSENFCRP